jgi:hypothetical protein
MIKINMIMRSIAFCFLSTLLLLAFTRCSEDEKIPVNIGDVTGTWYEEDSLIEYNRISRLEYTFKADSSLEILRIELDLHTGQVLGYRYRTVGDYMLVGDKLSFINQVSYGNDDLKGSYSDINNLQLVVNENGISYTIAIRFEDNGKKLVFIYPPCGELANCIGSKTLLKGDKILENN